MPRRQDHGGKKKTDIVKGFFSELITGLMPSTADDLARKKVYDAHSGDFVLRKVRGRIGILKLNLSNYVMDGRE